jgi:hypothetical protein
MLVHQKEVQFLTFSSSQSSFSFFSCFVLPTQGYQKKKIDTVHRCALGFFFSFFFFSFCFLLVYFFFPYQCSNGKVVINVSIGGQENILRNVGSPTQGYQKKVAQCLRIFLFSFFFFSFCSSFFLFFFYSFFLTTVAMARS